MPITVITSRQNPLLKELQSIRDDHDAPLLFLEGPRLIQEALAARYALEILLVSEPFPETSFLEPIRARSKRVYRVSDSVFRAVSDVDNPQGLLAICRRPSWKWSDMSKRAPSPLVVLDGLQDPGNAASIARTAEAAGAAGILTTPSTARLFSPKALRGAMGSSLRLPVIEGQSIEEITAQTKKLGYSLLATRVAQKNDSAVIYTQIDWTKPLAIVLGREAKGISPGWGSLVDKTIYLPMQPPVESLNVSAAAAVLLYESYRQRTAKSKNHVG